jgi:hypothetical protein
LLAGMTGASHVIMVVVMMMMMMMMMMVMVMMMMMMGMVMMISKQVDVMQRLSGMQCAL